MLYSFARVSAVLGMRRQDYFGQSRGWLRLHEKGGKRHDVPAHHPAAAALDAYVAAAGLEEPKAALFQSADPPRGTRVAGVPGLEHWRTGGTTSRPTTGRAAALDAYVAAAGLEEPKVTFVQSMEPGRPPADGAGRRASGRPVKLSGGTFLLLTEGPLTRWSTLGDMYAVGWAYRKTTAKPPDLRHPAADYDRPRRLTRAPATAAEAQFKLGALYANGRGVPQGRLRSRLPSPWTRRREEISTREAYENAIAAGWSGDVRTDSQELIGITSTVYEHLEALAAGLERLPGEVASAILSRYCTVERYATAVEAGPGGSRPQILGDEVVSLPLLAAADSRRVRRCVTRLG